LDKDAFLPIIIEVSVAVESLYTEYCFFRDGPVSNGRTE